MLMYDVMVVKTTVRIRSIQSNAIVAVRAFSTQGVEGLAAARLR